MLTRNLNLIQVFNVFFYVPGDLIVSNKTAYITHEYLYLTVNNESNKMYINKNENKLIHFGWVTSRVWINVYGRIKNV